MLWGWVMSGKHCAFRWKVGKIVMGPCSFLISEHQLTLMPEKKVKNFQIFRDILRFLCQDNPSTPQFYASFPKAAAAQLFVFKEESSNAESQQQLLPVTHASPGRQEPLPPLQSQTSISPGLWPALLERGVFDFKSCHQMSPLACFDSGQLDYGTRPSSSLCCHAIYLNRLNLR